MDGKAEQELAWFRTEILPNIITNGTWLSAEDWSAVQVTDMQLKFIGVEEAFMLTTCYRVTLQYRHTRHANAETCVFVVKKTPLVPQDMYEAIGFGRLFNNEITTYNCIIESIEKFTHQSFTAPKYFFSQLREDFGVIVLEDYARKGWQLCEAKYDLSLEHILLAVKYLANFHGIGFAMKACDSANFEHLVGRLQESRYFGDAVPNDLEQQLISSRKRLSNAVQKCQPQIPADFLTKLINLLENYIPYCRMRVAPQPPMTTICHGDYLRNNLAFRNETIDGKHLPIAVMMYDFQTMRLSSPMVDLSVLLLLSAFTEIRYKHFDQIFQAYCSTLTATYEKFAKSKAPSHLSYDSLLKEYTAFLPYALSISSFFLLNLVQPREITNEETLLMERSNEEIELDMLTRGGDVVDRELAHQALELYELSTRLNVDFSRGFE